MTTDSPACQMSASGKPPKTDDASRQNNDATTTGRQRVGIRKLQVQNNQTSNLLPDLCQVGNEPALRKLLSGQQATKTRRNKGKSNGDQHGGQTADYKKEQQF